MQTINIGDNMNILITGAASGIGYDTGVKLAKMGYHVFLTTEDDTQLEVLREKVNKINNIGTFRLNLTKKEDRKLLENFDVDILISNAAIGQGGSILDIDMKKIRECYDVNLFYNVEIIKTVLKNMIKKENGKIIVISSILSNISLPFFGIYASSKASLSSLCLSLKKELKLVDKNIKLKIVEPGIYKTGFNRFMIDNSNVNKYYLFNKSIEDLEKELLNFIGKEKTNTIVNKIVQAVKDNTNKTIYRAPILHNIALKFYIKFIKK